MNRDELLMRLVQDNKYVHFQDNQYSKRNKKEIKTETVEGITTQQISRDKNIFLFIDTCSLLNHASKGDFESFFKIADLHFQNDAILLVPEQLVVEWDRNKEETIYRKEMNSLKDIIRKTTSFRDKVVDDPGQKEQLSKLIAEAENIKTDQVEYVGNQTIAFVGEILDIGEYLPTKDHIKIQGMDWGLEKRAPFHKDKNSSGDTILFLTLMDCLEKMSNPILYFITDNKTDFSESKEQPHILNGELESYALGKGITIEYFLSLNEALDSIIEEVTDVNYVEEYKAEYENKVQKCPICNHEIVKDLHEFDGIGQKIYYKCTNCSYTDETNTYQHEEIEDQYY